MIPWIHSRQLRRLAYLFFTTCITAAQDLTESHIELVNTRLAESARESWELGTRAQTILERSATSYSVFSKQSLPPPSNPDVGTLAALRPVFEIVNRVVSSRSRDPQPLMPSGSAADPASLGVAVLIANWTNGANGLDYAGAAKSQIDYLFSRSVPKTGDGAFSHRVEQVQLWSDSVYMVPPFLAYYGVMTRDIGMVREAHKQIRLYRKELLDPARNMWRHVALGNGVDPGCWSTGNGWAAAGMLRVYATIQNSEYAPSFQRELQDLGSWVQEIHKGMYGTFSRDNSSIFANYADRPVNSNRNFYDAASTALLASTVYRAAQILGQKEFVPLAERSRLALSAPNAHFTRDGVLFPVVNPLNVGIKATKVSPEAQAFAVQMHQAWKDWKQ